MCECMEQYGVCECMDQYGVCECIEQYVVCELTTANSSASSCPSLSMSERAHIFPRTSTGSLEAIITGLAFSPDSFPPTGPRTWGGGGGGGGEEEEEEERARESECVYSTVCVYTPGV